MPAVLLTAALLGATACDLLTGPDIGALTLVTNTTGGSLDKDGYTLIVHDSLTIPIGIQDTVTLDSVPDGRVELRLEGVQSNCTVVGSNPRWAIVRGGEIEQVTFAVTCQYQLALVTARDGNHEIYLINADGAGFTNLTQHPSDDFDPQWSPDGTRLAFVSSRDGTYKVYLMNGDGSDQRPLTTPLPPDYDFRPRWSPNGSQIAFKRYSHSDQTSDVWLMDADGGTVRNVSNSPAAGEELGSWAPDGNWLAFTTDRDGNWEIYVARLNASELINLTANRAVDAEPAWSPTGEWIAFTSDRNAAFAPDIYRIRPDGSGVERLTMIGPAWEPQWSPDGSWLAFLTPAAPYLMRSDGAALRRLGSEDLLGYGPQWSADGSLLAVNVWKDAAGTGHYEVYVLPVQGTPGYSVTTGLGGGQQAAWRP